tara:strand:+ start:277 stop:636 length:360 start_codon:yes stop_codon:yes gene_type:complete
MAKPFTRANVLQLGLLILVLGGLGYGFFKFLGFEDISAGIAAEAVLILIVIGWTSSYLLRVVSGKMTFMEQRKRYRQAYEQITEKELQQSFDGLSEKEQMLLLKELEKEKKIINSKSDL